MDEREQKKILEWQRRDREESIGKIKVGCILGMILVPSFSFLDFYKFTGSLPYVFLGVRLACSTLIGVFLAILLTSFGRRHYRPLGVSLILLPGAAISYMVYKHTGVHSPYYAGLNLVLLVVGFVLRWTYRESLIAVLLVFAEYLLACHFNEHGLILLEPDLWNNLYFMGGTGIIVVTGNYFFTRSRYHEFELAYDLAEQTREIEAKNLQLEESRNELERSNQKLMELDQAKSRFFANISHELRTPLTLLLAPLETLLQKYSRSLDEETHEVLVTMHANGMRLLKLINDLLELVRLESGRVQVKPEPTNFPAFIAGLASAARQVAEDKQLHLEIHCQPGLSTALIDKDKLEKILLNLLFNAIKFTPAGGRVALQAERLDKNIRFTVSDTGVGISSKNISLIFDRFWQVDGSSKRKYQGAGIGLSLVKELTEAMGGKVLVSSTEGKGTSFEVLLPFEPAPEPSPEAAPQPIATPADAGSSEEWLASLYRRAELFPALASVRNSVLPVETQNNCGLPKVLVADDEPDMLRFLKSQLCRSYNVIEAIDGQQAVEKAAQFLPDLIILDMMMPNKDGLQACAEIREHTPTCNIPVILLTARADDATKMAALRVGASDFLAKPFSTVELQVRIKNLVENHAFQAQLSRQNRTLEFTNDRLKSVIEKLKETELQLIQTEKLASLGRMSAGIIHEINNPLNYANTGLMVLKKKGDTLAPEQRAVFMDVLKDIEEGIGRVINIVTDLRTFSHKDTRSRDPVLIAEAVQFALRLLSHEWKDTITVRQNIPPDLRVMANKNLIIQVLVNLIKNAIDAVGAKTFPAGTQPTIEISGRLEAGGVFLSIRDNGCGIEPAVLGKIFDPFFTTKDQGHGMGLGLSLCYSIIESFSAKISVQTEPGLYSEFTLEFPKVSDSIS